jgi:hypothetical protein
MNRPVDRETPPDTSEREQQRREAALDETIAESFPASDSPSTDPNPDSHDAVTPARPADDI